jgi:hypothetical protein
VHAPVDLKLRVQTGQRPRAMPADAEVVLRDPDGTVWAYGSEQGDVYRVHFPGVADFSFRPGSIEVIAQTRESSELVDDLFRTAVMPLALQVSGYEVLHASAVRTESGVAAFCGLSGAGKSTVAYGLSQRGYPIWADDAVVFSPADDRTIACLRIPFKLHLRDASVEYFAASEQRVPVVDEHRDECALSAVVILERVGIQTPRVERVAIGDAFRALLPHAYRFTLTDPARARRTIESYLDLAASVPVFHARYASGFSQLPELLNAIERSVQPALAHA